MLVPMTKALRSARFNVCYHLYRDVKILKARGYAFNLGVAG